MSAEKPREYACRVSENQPGTDVGSCFLIGTENDIFKDKLHMVLKEDYDTLTAERDALKKNMKLVTEEKEAFEKYCNYLIKKLEPSENTFESALGEIEHLKQCELVLGKQGIRDSGLRIENEKLKADLRCQINAQRETIRAAGELVERLQAEGYDRWREKYYDKITELNKAEADLALAVEALKYIAGCESKKCQDSGCMCVYQSAHQVLAKLGKGD